MRRSIDSPRPPVSRTGVAALLGTVVGGVIIGLIPNVIFSALGTNLRVVLSAIGFFLVLWAVAKLVMIRWSRELGIVLDLDPGDGRQWDGHAAQVALSQAKSELGRVAGPIAVTLPTDPVRRDEALSRYWG